MTTYYFSSKNYIRPMTLKPSGQLSYPRGMYVEKLLEKERPASCLSRIGAIPFYDDPKACPKRKNLYEVEPTGQFGNGHTGWVTMIENCQQDDWLAIQLYITQFWNGVDCWNRDGAWEYWATSLKVVKRI